MLLYRPRIASQFVQVVFPRLPILIRGAEKNIEIGNAAIGRIIDIAFAPKSGFANKVRQPKQSRAVTVLTRRSQAHRGPYLPGGELDSTARMLTMPSWCPTCLS